MSRHNYSNTDISFWCSCVNFYYNFIIGSLKSKLMFFIIPRHTLWVSMRKSNNFSSTDLGNLCTPRLHVRDSKEIINPFVDYCFLFKVMLMKRFWIPLFGKTILEIWTKGLMVLDWSSWIYQFILRALHWLNCLFRFLAVQPTILFVLSFLIVFKDYYFSNESKISQFLLSSSLVHDSTPHKTSATKSKPWTSSSSIELNL